MTHLITGTQTCGDSVDMDSDLRTVVTGGGTGGEGIQLWDLRNMTQPFCKIAWGRSHVGEPVNRSYNSVKFVPNAGLVIAACTDDTPAKCFSFKYDGQSALVQDFSAVNRSCFTVDVSKDGTLVALGDYNGKVQISDVSYMYL